MTGGAIPRDSRVGASGPGPQEADQPAAPGRDYLAAPTVPRILLGIQLRRLREARGISARDAALAIRASGSKISRIELGRNAVREVDVADLLSLYQVTDRAERDRLLALASQANQHGWWRDYLDVIPGWFQAYIGLEESANIICSYETQFIPGLLQTEDYAAAVIRAEAQSATHASRLVDVRKERQRRLTSGSLRLRAVIDEVALRRPVGDAAVMRDQYQHLLAMADQPGLIVQVTPMFTSASYASPGSFSILHFPADELADIVYVEQLTSALYLDKRADVDRYAAVLTQIVASSMTQERSADLIRALLAGPEPQR
jgi:transcriptional regulator with XRE-family HTH domain